MGAGEENEEEEEVKEGGGTLQLVEVENDDGLNIEFVIRVNNFIRNTGPNE